MKKKDCKPTVCKNCNVEFFPKKRKDRSGVYCSPQCYHIGRVSDKNKKTGPIVKICNQCGENFEVIKGGEKYCLEHRFKKKSCKLCKKEFFQPRGKVKAFCLDGCNEINRTIKPRKRHAAENYINKKFGQLLVIRLFDEKKYISKGHTSRELVFEVQCACGNLFTVGHRRLNDGRSKHCRSCASVNKISINPGDKFNKWTVLEEIKYKQGQSYYKCQCVCGNIGIQGGSPLARGRANGCKECGRKDVIKHGLSFSVEYRVWTGMRERCRNPKQASYLLYGGRGIAVCERWNDFNNFLQDMGPRPVGKRISIDRIDNEGDYEPGNCRWTTPKENTNNRRNSKKNRDKYIYVLKDKLCEDCKHIK